MRYIIPIIILCLAAGGYWYIKDNAPQARKRPTPSAPSIQVETQQVKQASVRLQIQSYGQVSAKTESNLTAQVSGTVTSVADNFQEGAFFNKGDLLISIDSRDYQNTINSAKANLTQAQQDLALEKAKVEQAKADWRRLNKNAKIPALVSRTPQVISAKAKVSAMHASYNQAIINFKRTKIHAPFDGRVLSKSVNQGDYVNANSALAQIISSDALQVRLPLKNSDLAYVDLPEQFIASTQQTSPSPQPNVQFTADLISDQLWQGKLVRTEAAIDESSQQLFVIAEIEAPFSAQHSDKHPLKIGQYVSANIEGRVLPKAISVNVENIYQGQFVYVVEKGIIQRRPITILWRNDTIALIGEGLKAGDMLIISLLSDGSQGSPAKSAKDSKGNKAGKGKKGDKNSQKRGPNKDKRPQNKSAQPAN